MYNAFNILMIQEKFKCTKGVLILILTANFLFFIYLRADPEFQVRGAQFKNCAERREARKYLGY